MHDKGQIRVAACLESLGQQIRRHLAPHGPEPDEADGLGAVAAAAAAAGRSMPQGRLLEQKSLACQHACSRIGSVQTVLCRLCDGV